MTNRPSYSEALERIEGLITGYLGRRDAKIHQDTRLVEDLGIDGDDAYELICEFCKQLNVDCTGFRFDRHFSNEASLSILARLIRPIGSDAKQALLIRHLILAAMTGRWPDLDALSWKEALEVDENPQSQSD